MSSSLRLLVCATRAIAAFVIASSVVCAAACGDSNGGTDPTDSGVVVRLDGELPDVARPSLDAFTGLETSVADEGTPPPVVDAASPDAMSATDAAPPPAADVGPGGDAGPSCADTASLYATQLALAQACVLDTDCTELVCDGPCCNCQVHVRAGTGAALAGILELFAASRCHETIACPDFFCPEPTGVTCYRGACMTSRERAGAE